MPKLKPDSIQKSDFEEYLDSSSDFSFELSVLKMLRGNEIECEHGGLYEDPVTNKSREFDIRASKKISNYVVRLAIECKNIRENFPVLVSCVPRHEDESYHQVAHVSGSGSFDPHQSRASTISIRGEYSIYKPEGLIGKSTVQVGRALDGSISANDSELHDKWGQCLNSLNDLVIRSYWDGEKEEGYHLSTVLPIVVVPNTRLWSVAYDYNGNRVSEPRQTERCSCFINKDYRMGTRLAGTRIWVSHVEIMTIDGLKSFVESHLKTEDEIIKFFSEEGISESFGPKAKK